MVRLIRFGMSDGWMNALFPEKNAEYRALIWLFSSLLCTLIIPPGDSEPVLSWFGVKSSFWWFEIIYDIIVCCIWCDLLICFFFSHLNLVLLYCYICSICVCVCKLYVIYILFNSMLLSQAIPRVLCVYVF